MSISTIDGGGASGDQGTTFDGNPPALFSPPKAIQPITPPAVSIVSICNQALGRIGISSFIQDINERSLEATVCKQFYESARNRCLEDFPWNFADTYADLQDIGSPPPGWGYRYRYPGNCQKAREIKSAAFPGGHHPPRFAVISDEASGGKAIACNLQGAVLRYTARVTNPSLFTAKFIDALAWLLASDVAAPLASKPEYAKTAGDAYAVAILRAGADNMNEGHETRPAENDYLRARR